MHTLDRLASLPPLRFDKHTRAELKQYFLNTWELYEALKSSIAEERYFYEAPDPLRHPLIFYLGHTAAFYVNKLKMSGYIKEGLNPRYEVLFAVGVDPEKEDDLEKGIDWPAVADVWAYRADVKKLVLDFIDNAPLMSEVDTKDPMWALHMGLEHERIHFETSSVLMRQYPAHYLKKPDSWTYAPIKPDVEAKGKMVHIEGGSVTLGKPADFPSYGWDNEYGTKEAKVASFEVNSLMVTNSEFADFVNDKGYERKEYWSDEGWAWKEEYSMSFPKFWIPDNAKGYRYRAMYDELDMPESWPVEVTCFEAQAYCKWKGSGYRLMTEGEWKLATKHAPEVQGDPMYCNFYNMNMAFGSPSPVGMMKSCFTQDGVADLFGNVWDWISNDFYPLEGFRRHDWYQDFSEPYMDEQHGMLMGAAWATTGTGASKYYRLWFRRGFFQHAGFRLARSL